MKFIKCLLLTLVSLLLVACLNHSPGTFLALQRAKSDVAEQEKLLAESYARGKGPKQRIAYTLPSQINMVVTDLYFSPGNVQTRTYTPEHQYPFSTHMVTEVFASYGADPVEYYGAEFARRCQLDNFKLSAAEVAEGAVPSCLIEMCTTANIEVLEKTKDYVLYMHDMQGCEGPVPSYVRIGKAFNGVDGVYGLEYLDKTRSGTFYSLMQRTVEQSRLVNNN